MECIRELIGVLYAVILNSKTSGICLEQNMALFEIDTTNFSVRWFDLIITPC